MFSSTMALFIRSFRVDARSTQPHLLRLLFACAIFLELLWIHEMEVLFGAPGLTVFRWIAWLNFVVITLAAVGYFATAISEEKEEDSLGLLKMAGIGPVALLLGKSTTRLIAVLLMLAVEFPFVLLSITLGGVTMTQVLGMAAALAAYLIFVANLGLFCSVVGSNSRRACTLMTLSLIVILAVLPALGAFSREYTAFQRKDTPGRRFLVTFADCEQNVSMWYRISTVVSTGFAESPLSWQVLAHLGGAVGFFALSWAGFERFTRERHAVRPLERMLARRFPGRGRRRPGRPWPMALTWKDFHFVLGGKRMVLARFVLYFIIIAGLVTLFTWDAPGQLTSRLVGGTAMTAMLIAGAIELGLVAARVFREEVQAHTLPLLMMLPKSTAQIVWSKAASAIPALVPTLSFFVLGVFLDAGDFGRESRNILTSWGGWYAIVWFVLFLHLAAYLSILVKWGALPLAIFLIYICQMFLFPLFMLLNWIFFAFRRGGGDAFLLPCLTAIGAAGIAFLEYRIPRRLHKLAGR